MASNTKPVQCMADLETLDTEPNSAILSVGALAFTLEGGRVAKIEHFHMKVDPKYYDTDPHGFSISEATLAWWKEKPNYEDMFSGTNDLPTVLLAFCKWWTENFDRKRTQIWAQGADFDFPILKNALKKFGMEVPWDYWNQRDTRTLYSLVVGVRRLPIAHDALGDCINQVLQVCDAYKRLKKK